MKTRLLISAALAATLVGSAAQAETLRIPHELGFGGSESMDPISPQRFYEAIQNVYSRLVRQGEDGRPSADLALSWETTKDAKEWTFHLRPGVTFHNGNAFTAEDVAFSLMRTQSDTIDSPTKGVMAIIDHVEVLDDMTAKVVLKQTHADFPLLVMDYRIKMLDAETCGGDLDAICDSGVGTGPYKLVELDALGTTTLERFDAYYGGTPGVEAMELIAIADQNARVAALQAGQVDFIYALSAEQLPLFQNNPNFVVQSVPTGRWVGMIMNTTVAPFDDPRVRKAIRMSADRDALGKLVYGAGGYITTCDHPVWSGDQYRTDISCARDIDGAKALLADAGYEDGLTVELFVSDISEGAVKMAEVLQNQAQDAGIKIELVQAPSDGFWSDVWMKEPFFATGWSQRPADQILNEAFRSGVAWNESAYTSASFDAGLDAARAELDFDARKALYGELQKTLWETGGSFIPVHLNTVRAFSAKLGGIQPVEDFSIRYEDVTKAE
ncbi:peptide ABC transporter substrate-binding protein [Epibacterium sp. SM1969]|uniref:Peptide ABC transporter substrate-binding protein n=1 Tax=Tritonibacter aquimaris TaxID=2663379 RepID=A0A844AL05_9RHOB|nr:ABC transporter substrate-binding protein [Tritonibacter aquimaris]MQY42560.1 peptide ABC transporter substrate-binding protein [Tritonibacter aquimaris]